MREFAGRSVTITLESDVLVLTNKGVAGAGADINAALARRIPSAAIKDVLFKDGNFSDGYIWFVVGDNETPTKASLWKATGDEDAVVFRPGKQAKAMRELHKILLSVIAANRASGVDPTSVVYDAPRSGEEILVADNGLKLEGLGLRDDLALAASKLLDIPKPIRRILASVSDHLVEGETVEAVTVGAYGNVLVNVPALLVLTEQRVFLFRDRALLESDTIPRNSVVGVTWAQGLVGRLEIVGAGRSIVLRATDRLATVPIVAKLREAADTPADNGDVLERLERLVALRDAGALTPEEFDQQKALLLGQPEN